MDRLFWRAARAQVRVRTFGARQWIFWSQEMSFDYLIAFIAQKLVKIDLVEFWSYLKIFNILKKKRILPWKMQFSCNFNIFYFHQYLSYKYDQVVKRHLFDHTNPLARIICARAARRESSTMSGKHVFLNLWLILARARPKNFIFEFSTSKRTKKSISIFSYL